MNLGKRIEQRLKELKWSRSMLFEKVPDLSPARLSALISRDSKRCELDVQIAKALGVHLAWLNDGSLPKLLDEEAHTELERADVLNFPSSLLRELVEVAKKISDDGLNRLIERANILAIEFPKQAKGNRQK